MKKSILIAGVSGSGKSEVSRRLRALGYETHDMDGIEDLCVMVDKKSGLPTSYDNNNDLEKIEKMYWLYKKDKLEEIIANQKNELVFYCGAPNNLEEIVSLFSRVILLVASPENIRQRLIDRKDNGFGKSVEVQNYILERKEKIEKSLIDKGALMVDANRDIESVMDKVLEMSRLS
ncbi:MAG: AAA family ATPase [Candidatus Moranbacteria bacterium]|nr:AAA family ATPase [Candidatus Moranbacteria bacterium]